MTYLLKYQIGYCKLLNIKMILSVFTVIFLINAAPTSAQPPAKVVVMKVFEKETAKTELIMGVIDFDKRSGISSEISGLIKSQDITEGAVIKKGFALVHINTDFIENSIAMTRKEIEQIEIKIKSAQRNLDRYDILLQKNITSKKIFEDFADQVKENIKQKEIATQKLARLRLEIKKAVIYAPFDGLILEKYKNEGEWLNPGEPVCLLASRDDMIVKVAVSEELIAFVQPGAKVGFTVPALNRKFTGKIIRFAPVADVKSKTFPIKIAAPYFKQALRNMSVAVNVPVSHKMKLKMMKRDALVLFQGKNFVYTVKDGKAKILPVNIVSYEDELIGVDNPYIVPGMPVVIDGNDRLRPDQAATVANPEGVGQEHGKGAESKKK